MLNFINIEAQLFTAIECYQLKCQIHKKIFFKGHCSQEKNIYHKKIIGFKQTCIMKFALAIF